MKEFLNEVWDFALKPIISVAVLVLYVKVLWIVGKYVWNLF
jgi:hypothetical protein